MLLLLALSLVAQLPGGIELDPRLRWYTLESEHFAVHFPCSSLPDNDCLALPRAVCSIAEAAHARLTSAAAWHPVRRTNVVIADFFDYSNGWAAPFPANTITVLPSLPAGDLTNYDDWLTTLFVHEYSHILALDQARGPLAALRGVFGRIVLPNSLAPFWLHEGYAVHNETRFTRFGRNRGAEFRMMLDAAARHDRLLPLDRCGSYLLRRYPGGSAPYLYGGRFVDWLARTYGQALPDSLNSLRARSLPWTEGTALSRLTGQRLGPLWREWQTSVRTEALRPGPTVARRLTNDGFAKSGLAWSRSGAELFFVSGSGLEHPCIRALDSAGRYNRIVCRAVVNGNLALSPDGLTLAFGEYRLLDNTREFSDIVTLDLATGARRRLTERLRARDPDFAPDTGIIAFVIDGGGRNRLALLDLTTREVTTLLEPEEPVAFHSPRFSPSGRWLVVGVNRPGGFADIELIDRRTGWVTPLTEDRHNDINPCWSRTGRFVYFASDRTGVFEIFAFELATGRLFQCTATGTGLLCPTLAPDNQSMAVSAYGPNGFDIATIPVDASSWTQFERGADTLEPIEPPARGQDSSATLYYYSALPGLAPAFWCPLLCPGMRAGVFTLGWDPLQSHRYSALAGYDFRTASPFLSAGYEYRGWWAKPGFALDLTLPAQSIEAFAGVQLRSYERDHWFDLSLNLHRDSIIDSRLAAGWAVSTARAWRFSVAPSEGIVAGLAADYSTPVLFGSNTLVRAVGHSSLYLGAPRRSWSLRLRLAAATALGDSAAAAAFRIAPGPAVLGVRGFHDLDLPVRTALSTGVQLRLPLWWVERGIGGLPVFIQNINGAAFVDAITGSPSRLDLSTMGNYARVGAGLELRADLILGHLLPASLTVGAAAGLHPFGSTQLYGSMSSDLLSGLILRPRAGLHDWLRLPERH